MLKSKRKVIAIALTGGVIATSVLSNGFIAGQKAVAASKVAISWMASGQPQEIEGYKKMIAKFEKKVSNVKVNLIQVASGDNYNVKIQAAMASGRMPDVFYMNPSNVKAWVGSGKILNLTKYVKNSKDIMDEKNMWQVGVNKYRFDGKNVGKGDIYAVPKDVGPFAFAYNKTMFKKAGIALPDKDKPYTWTQWIDVCKKLTKDTNGDGKLDQWGTGLNVQWSLQSFVWGNGADWANADRTKVTVTDPKFVEALQFFADQTLKYKITPDAKTAATLDTYQRWLKGQEAFFPAGPWDIAVFNTLKFDYDLMPWPASPNTGKTATWVGSLGIAVAKNTAHPKEAAKLAMYLSGEEDTQRAGYKAGIIIPNRIDMAKGEYLKSSAKPENKQEFIDIVENYGKAFPADQTYNAEWYDEFFTGINAVLDGRKTAKEYCKEIQPKMQKLLDKSIKMEKSKLGK